MAKIYGTPLMMGGGGGGQNLTLPPMVTNLAAKGSNATITVSWTNPESDALSGVAVVYNSTHTPDKPSDGTKVDAGLSETASLTGLENGTLYYIRVFPYNAKKQYQTLLNGATTSATPNIGPAQVTNFQVTGSGASPVLTWTNPADDPLYYQTVVVQKVGSAPTSITDGTEIYRGTGTTVTASNLVRLEEYYWAVFTVDEGGSYRTPVVSEMYSYDFPDEPTSYSDLIMVRSTQTWTAPEDGYFRFIVCGRGGNGGGYPQSNGSVYGGGGGGAGGIAVSVFALNKGETVSCICSTVQTQINYNGNVATANPGEDGEKGRITSENPTGKGGAGGTATGGNVTNKKGGRGENGIRWTANADSPNYNTRGDRGTNSYDDKTISGGRGEGHRNRPPNDISIRPTAGTIACIYIQRGNTNVPSPSAASMLSLTPRNASIEANWENSQDPESVGTMVVINSDHEPTTPEDGTSVDVAEATTYTISDLPNDTPTYVSLFAYNADKTKYSMAKSDVEIPREVTWYDVQEDLKADIANAQEEAEYLTKENLTMANAGIMQVEAYCAATSNPPMADNGVFASGVDEWKAGVEYKLNDLFTYQGNMGYVKQPTLTSLDVYPPFSVGTEALYGARPKPDADGIYPYVYNMGIYKGMLVRDDDGFVYRSITGTQDRPTELLYHPKDVPALLVKVEDEGGEEIPSEEYPEWVQPTGAHDAYAQGAKVSHNGKKWTSDIAANVWEPGVYGWTEVIE